MDPDEFFPVDPNDTPLLTSDVAYERVGLLNCAVSGDRDGKLVVLLHGFPETGILSWHKQIDPLVEQGFFVVAPDQRGYNQSAKPESVQEYEVDLLAGDIVKVIEHYKRSKAIIVGHDWGAVVAWVLGNKFPNYVEKLVIMNVPHPQVMQDKLRSSWKQLTNSWYMFFFQVPWVAEAKIRKDGFYWLTGALAMAAPGTFSRQLVRRYHQSWSEPQCVESMLAWYRQAIRGSIPPREKIGRVSVPTLMLWGDNDTALDASMAQPSIEMCDDGELVMVPGISHWVQHEAPAVVNRELLKFLSK